MRTICVCERGRMMIYGRDCFSADEGGHRARREGADERPGGEGASVRVLGGRLVSTIPYKANRLKPFICKTWPT